MTLTGRSVEAQRSVMRALDDEGRRASERRRLETPEGTATAPPKERSASDSNDDSNDDSGVSAVITKAIVPVGRRERSRAFVERLMEFATGIQSHAAVGKLLCGSSSGTSAGAENSGRWRRRTPRTPPRSSRRGSSPSCTRGPRRRRTRVSPRRRTRRSGEAERHVQLTFFKRAGRRASSGRRADEDGRFGVFAASAGRARGAFLAERHARARSSAPSRAIRGGDRGAGQVAAHRVSRTGFEPQNGIPAERRGHRRLASDAEEGWGGRGGWRGRRGGPSVAEMEDLVRTTLACGDQLRRTVDDMLDMSRLEAGKLELRETSFDAERLVRGVTTQIKSATERKGLALETRVSPLLRGVQLRGDSGRIEQVLINFCWNAVKFTNEGSVAIDVTCELREGGSPYVARSRTSCAETSTACRGRGSVRVEIALSATRTERRGAERPGPRRRPPPADVEIEHAPPPRRTPSGVPGRSRPGVSAVPGSVARRPPISTAPAVSTSSEEEQTEIDPRHGRHPARVVHRRPRDGGSVPAPYPRVSESSAGGDHPRGRRR